MIWPYTLSSLALQIILYGFRPFYRWPLRHIPGAFHFDFIEERPTDPCHSTI